MKRWLQLPFALLALMAMFATALPQTLWACPMTGRVDYAARVCLGVMPLVSGEMPRAHFGGKCCKPLTLPPTQNDDTTKMWRLSSLKKLLHFLHSARQLSLFIPLLSSHRFNS